MGKHYWMHRVSHEGGLKILAEEKRITVGFSDVAASSDACNAIGQKNYNAFCSAYTAIYKGAIERCKNGLWRFVVEMKTGDIVIVPKPYGFFICKVTGDAVVCQRPGLDLGWEREIDILADCSPREDYAQSGLLSRMKCQQTNLCIDDIASEVDEALDRKIKNTPFDIIGDVGKALRKELEKHCSPENFERRVASYFKALGAQATVLSKNYSDKQGDCDVEAIFPALRLTVSVQCKKHFGTTDDWAVRQISDYADKRVQMQEDDNWTHAFWVVTLADGFTPAAQALAKEKKVTLINGEEFCRMMLAVGIQ